MDRELRQRLDHSMAPFDGNTLAPGSMLPIRRLSEVLSAIVDVIRSRGAGRPLYMLLDRHESDGQTTESRVIPWEWLDEHLGDCSSLYDQRSGEALVSLGFYHADPAFYLRTYVMNEDEDDVYPGRWGDFDLSGSAELIDQVRDLLTPMNIDLAIERSYRYFGQRAAE